MSLGRPAVDTAGHDRPWRRPGRLRYTVRRIGGMMRPPVTVDGPEPGSVLVEDDQPVVTRDGTILRVNVYRPPHGTQVPVVVAAHPYGKDDLPRRSCLGRWTFSPQ